MCASQGKQFHSRVYSQTVVTDPARMPLVFISHSSVDGALAEAVARLIHRALSLDSADVRCSSAPGYRLPAGSKIDEALGPEVTDSTVFIAILTPSSLQAPYVLLECGARWGAGRPLIPVVGRGTRVADLKPPISSWAGLDLEDVSQVHQLLRDVGKKLNRPIEPPDAIHADITQVVHAAKMALDPSPTSLPTGAEKPDRTSSGRAWAAALLLALVAGGFGWLIGANAGSDPRRVSGRSGPVLAAGTRLSIAVSNALQDRRSWVQALVRDLTAQGGIAVLVKTQPHPDGWQPYRLHIGSAVQGTIIGYASRCSGSPVETGSCELLTDKFVDARPEIQIPAGQPHDWVVLVLTLATNQDLMSANFDKLFTLEVL